MSITAGLMVLACVAGTIAGVAVGRCVVKHFEKREDELQCATSAAITAQAKVTLAQAKVARSAAERLDNDLRGALRV